MWGASPERWNASLRADRGPNGWGAINRVAVIVLLAQCAAGPAAAQDYNTWRSQCAETRLAGTVCAAGPRARVMSFDVIVNARGEGETAHL